MRPDRSPQAKQRPAEISEPLGVVAQLVRAAERPVSVDCLRDLTTDSVRIMINGRSCVASLPLLNLRAVVPNYCQSSAAARKLRRPAA